MKPLLIAAGVAVLSTVVAGHAHAQARTETETPASSSWPDAVRRTSASGAFLPLSLTPSVGTSSAQAAGFGGYDSASGSARMQSFAEAKVIAPVALRIGAELRSGEQELAPSIGLRVQVLSQERQGVIGAVAVFYKAEGFSEPEGEIETVLSIGTRVGRTLLIGNLAYGQDPEGNERDGELRAATLVALSDWLQLGLDARGRFDLGSDRAKLRASNEPTYDVDAGPVLTVALGPLALGAHAGVSVIRRLDQKAEAGAIALGGLGTAF